MKCPKCMRPVDHEAESCYSCGYSEKESAKKFGSNQVLLSRVHDAAHCLRKQEKDVLNSAIDQLELKFPQMLFCAYLGTLPGGLSMSELGFWLLNHGQVKGAEYARPNENAILVILDMNAKKVGISLGYFAESLIAEEESYRALMKARPNLLNGEYGEAIETIFRRLCKVLEKKGKKMRKLSHEELQAQSKALNENTLDLPEHSAPVLGLRRRLRAV